MRDGKRARRSQTDGESRLNIPGYTPVRGLGVDRAGALVEARAQQGGARVVVRLLSPALLSDKVLLKRIRRETGRLTGLEHPNLVRVLGFDERAGALITEFPAGVTLRRLLDGSGPLTPEAGFVLMSGVLAAVGALHGAGVLHRDLRPELVYIDAAGAVRVRDAGVPTAPLRAGWAAGTPRYLAPELWDGGEHSVATDLYAATALFHEALTGEPPFTAGDLDALRAQHHNGQIAEDALPPSGRALVLEGMATEPRARPHSAADYQKQLQVTGASFFEEGWHQNGETWLSEAAAARLMEPPPVERAAVLIPEEELRALPEPEPEPRPPSRLRRRLALLGAVGAAAFVALAVVLVGVALLGHGGGAQVEANPAASSESATPALSVQTSDSPSATASDTGSPSEDVTPPGQTESPTGTASASSPPVFNTIPPKSTPKPTHTPAATPTPCALPTVLNTCPPAPGH